MKFKILLIIMILTLVNLASAYPFHYKIDLSYNKGEIDIKNINIVFLDEKIENKGNYLIKLLDENKILDSFNFEVPNKILVDELNEEGEIITGEWRELNQTEFEIYIPYNEKAKQIIIYDSNLNELIKKDVSRYSKDKKLNENKKIIEKEDEKESLKSKERLDSFVYKYLIFILISILIIGLIIYLIIKMDKRKTKKSQVTVFIILGLIIIAGIVIIFFVSSNIKSKITKKSFGDDIIFYTESCLKESLVKSLKFFGTQGIIYNNSEDFGNLSFVNIPFYYYEKENRFPTIIDSERILESFIDPYFEGCIDDYSPLKEKGYEIKTNKKKIFVNIHKNKVEASAIYPITIRKEDKTEIIETFKSDIQFDFSKVNMILSEFIEEQNKNPNNIPIGYISVLSNQENILIQMINLQDGIIIYSFTFNDILLDGNPYLLAFGIKYDWSDLKNETIL